VWSPGVTHSVRFDDHTPANAPFVAAVRNEMRTSAAQMTLHEPWLDPLFDAAEMRAADAWAIDEQGVPSLDLMERAGVGLARVTAAAAGPGPIRVVVGKGNNGGDGLVVARLLRQDGYEVDVLAAASLDGLGGDPLANLERLPGAPPEPFAPEGLAGSGAVVDALLGTGFEGEPREPLASAIAAINAQEAPVVACDVPSGVDASTGEVAGEAVRAVATATFHGPKIGLCVNPGKEHAGVVEVVEIGIPRGAPGAERGGLIAERVLDLYPRRERSGSKFESGVVVVAGGSVGLTGAPTMAARSAQRAGAGYVQVAVPAPAQAAVDLRLLEQMSRGLPDADGSHTPEGVAVVEEMAERAGAVALGPGLGRAPAAQEFARGVARAVAAPLLLDADGLNAHAGRLESLHDRPGPTVLTPHEAELGRLLDRPTEQVAAHRLAAVREAAERSGAVVLLKGDDTVVALPAGGFAVNPAGSPALATAGTGDVLSGLIAALLAKGLGPFEAACLGARAHALAADAAAERVGVDHVMAGDVIDALPYGLTLR
jgi:NAD(P)H-hydrate epimerase